LHKLESKVISYFIEAVDGVKAAILEEVGKPLRYVTDFPEPKAERDMVLVRLIASGICWADLAFARGYWRRRGEIIKRSGIKILGHEGVGMVKELGSYCEGIVREGQRVGIPLINSTCGVCDACLSGFESKCERRIATGEQINGTFAEYAVIREKYAIPIPDSVSDEEAGPMLDAGVTAYSAVKRISSLGVSPGRTVAVLGAAGGVGHYAVQIAKVYGYRVLGIDVGEERIKFAEEVGADEVADARESPDVVVSKFGKVSAAIVCATRIQAYNYAFKILAKTGIVTVIGAPSELEGQIPITPEELIGLGARVIPISVGTRLDQRELLNLAAQKKVKTYFKLYYLEQINKALEDLDSAKVLGRSVIKMI
jgi:propanol-preferring alcohol dehydrogenase